MNQSLYLLYIFVSFSLELISQLLFMSLENAALPHGSGSDRMLGPTDLALFDCGGTLHGYHSDITRVRILILLLGLSTSEFSHPRCPLIPPSFPLLCCFPDICTVRVDYP